MELEISDNNDTTEIKTGECEGTVSPPVFTPVAYTFRFTFSHQDKELKCLEDRNFMNRCKTIHTRLICHIRELDYFYNNKYTSSLEVMNKFGKSCSAHIHIHFYSDKSKESMARTIKRFLQDKYEEETTGNHAMSFKLWTKLRQGDDYFFRYPLKQNLNINKCDGFTKEELIQMHEIAKGEFQTVVEFNQKKIDKMDASDTIFEKVLQILKKSDNPKNARYVAKEFIQYYIENDKPINRTVIDGYVLNALVKLGVLTIDNILDKFNY